MLKTLAKDIMKHPDLWSRNETFLERSIIPTIRGFGTVKVHVFDVSKYSVWVEGDWYPVPWHKHGLLTRAKNAWIRYLFNDLKDTWLQNSMTTEEWIKWRQDQVDKK